MHYFPLKALLYAKYQSGKLARCSNTTAEFDLYIQYQPGQKHTNADALSRSPVNTDKPSQDGDKQTE